jgi:hypothetical protein
MGIAITFGMLPPGLLDDLPQDMPHPMRDPDGYLLWAQQQGPTRRQEIRGIVAKLQGPERARLLKLLDDNAPN